MFWFHNQLLWWFRVGCKAAKIWVSNCLSDSVCRICYTTHTYRVRAAHHISVEIMADTTSCYTLLFVTLHWQWTKVLKVKECFKTIISKHIMLLVLPSLYLHDTIILIYLHLLLSPTLNPYVYVFILLFFY